MKFDSIVIWQRVDVNGKIFSAILHRGGIYAKLGGTMISYQLRQRDYLLQISRAMTASEFASGIRARESRNQISWDILHYIQDKLPRFDFKNL